MKTPPKMAPQLAHLGEVPIAPAGALMPYASMLSVLSNDSPDPA
jgi:hypothetical protein